MSSEEITGLQSMTEKTLAPGSKLYELIQSRIGSQIQRALLTTPQPIDKTQLEKWGLSSLHQDITDLMEKVKVLGHFNRAVYGGLYANILQDIRQGLKSPLKSLFE
jgi:hypothetical protein